jgi:hypothetical protein
VTETEQVAPQLCRASRYISEITFGVPAASPVRFLVGLASMQIVETIARTRRQHFVQGKMTKEIARAPRPIGAHMFTRVPASETS